MGIHVPYTIMLIFKFLVHQLRHGEITKKNKNKYYVLDKG